MQQKIGNCIECPRRNTFINSKGLCTECVYKKNHGGKTRFEVELEKKKNKPVKVYQLKRTPLKPSLKPLKQTRLKKRITERGLKQIEKDEITYEEVFNSRPNYCEECKTELPDQFRGENEKVIYKTQYSHILGKQAFPEFRNDARNFNRLCGIHHDQWEFGERKTMKIYKSNQVVINQLLKERNEST